MDPRDVSAAPAPEESVTGPAYCLVLWTGLGKPEMGLTVVKVSYDPAELATWYKLERQAGRLGEYREVSDLGQHGSVQGGIWDVPDGATVFPGMRLVPATTAHPLLG